MNGKCSLIQRMPGDQWRQFAGLRTLALYQMTHPGAKLTFMGDEIGQYIEWRYYESIEWFLADEFPLHHGHRVFCRELNRLYAGERALWERAYTQDGFTWVDADDAERSVVSYIRHGKRPEDDLLVVINFTPAYYERFPVGVPEAGSWKQVFNSDEERFGGSGKGNPRALRTRAQEAGGCAQSIAPALPPLAGVVFKRVKPKNKASKGRAAKGKTAGKANAKAKPKKGSSE